MVHVHTHTQTPQHTEHLLWTTSLTLLPTEGKGEVAPYCSKAYTIDI